MAVRSEMGPQAVSELLVRVEHHPVTALIGDVRKFMHGCLTQLLVRHGINIGGFEIDHVCFRVDTNKLCAYAVAPAACCAALYSNALQYFHCHACMVADAELGSQLDLAEWATKLIEAPIGGRPISTYRLMPPLMVSATLSKATCVRMEHYDGTTIVTNACASSIQQSGATARNDGSTYTGGKQPRWRWEISCLELPAVKEGSPYARGLEHMEVVVGVAGVHTFHQQSSRTLLEAWMQNNALRPCGERNCFKTKALQKVPPPLFFFPSSVQFSCFSSHLPFN
eukprot:SAG11_NODE_126_length_15729_cov_9.966859_3_plen_282_part_00